MQEVWSCVAQCCYRRDCLMQNLKKVNQYCTTKEGRASGNNSIELSTQNQKEKTKGGQLVA